MLSQVLDQHIEEAAFLWLLRDEAVGAPNYDLTSITRLDQRINAHIDGLRVAGEEGWKVVWKEFQAHPEPGEAFVATLLAFESAHPGRTEEIINAVSQSRPLLRAVISAFGWLSSDDALIQSSIASSGKDPTTRYVELAGAAVQRMHPGPVLVRAMRNDNPRLRARALKAAGELGDTTAATAARADLASKDLDVKFAAAWSLARLTSDASAAAELQSIAVTESRYRRRAAEMAVRVQAPAAARRWIALLHSLPGCELLAIHASAALGDPSVVPGLIEKMASPPLARAAGEAISFITGVHIDYDKLDGAAPEGFEAGPTEDPDDDRVTLDPDDGLPWPDAGKVKAWWDVNRALFPPGVRHLCGKPIALEHLQELLTSGYQRQRAAAALELAIRNPRQPLFEVRAQGRRQMDALRK